jgi:WhiB family redox-sensing transcriptional regulator
MPHRLCASCDSPKPQRSAGLCHTCYGFHQANGSLATFSRLAELPAAPALDLDWMAQASCAQIGGDGWFPDKGNSPRDALRICAGCPVRETCLEHALAAGYRQGVWGGLTPTQRRQLQAGAA